eukprot:CAMPEP_0184322206 /NCGR_PEP_ID=MMETSP1049-20130417/123401_1 /TAXON_ID=77928 /ORGANISM="Proteomonas sulcata, Strain CCMP704" /LENGTH=380 /DNA_ID=CAMNT_0026643257 /DNA_START=81 /DNA_END=1223 /DNA_ORIENTATION=-
MTVSIPSSPTRQDADTSTLAIAEPKLNQSWNTILNVGGKLSKVDSTNTAAIQSIANTATIQPDSSRSSSHMPFTPELEWNPTNVFPSVFNDEIARQALSDFLLVWKRSPFRTNKGGMGFVHQFHLWHTTKAYGPKLIIESGVFKGATTWIMHEAAPDAEIICFDPYDPKLKVPGATYFTGRKFTDIAKHSFANVNPSLKSHALILIDDHQAALNRLKIFYNQGFGGSVVVFDDNWAPMVGDCRSLKQIFDETGSPREPYVPGGKDSRVMWLDNFGRVRKTISLDEHHAELEMAKRMLVAYKEMPLVLHRTWTRRNTPKPTDPKYATNELLSRGTAQALFHNQSHMMSYVAHRPELRNDLEEVNWNLEKYGWIAVTILNSK